LLLGDAAGATADFTAAIARNPDDGYSHYGRGVIRSAEGDRAGALGDFQAAARLLPEREPWHGEALARASEIESGSEEVHRGLPGKLM
jgi:tetratricopeptide (TPR) repeat protein